MKIILKTDGGTYVADANLARAHAAANTLRELRRDVKDFWPELWREAYWRKWIGTLSRLELAVILKQL